MANDQLLMLYWIDPVDAADRLAAKPELAENKIYFHYEDKSRSKDQWNEDLAVPIQDWYFRKLSS